MKTQFFNSHGDVVLSKWWRTPSAQAVERRVKKANRERFKALKAEKEQQQKLRPVARELMSRKVKRKR